MFCIHMEAKSEKILKDLEFVHLDKEIVEIITKTLKDLMKTVKNV